MARQSPIHLPALSIFFTCFLPSLVLAVGVPLENYRNGFRTEKVREARVVPNHIYDTEVFEEPFYAHANGSLSVFHPRNLAIIGKFVPLPLHSNPDLLFRRRHCRRIYCACLQ